MNICARYFLFLTGCGGDLTDETGQLTSPGYPSPYVGNVECIWTITVALGKRINITIDDFNVEHAVNCSYDVLEV